MAEKPPQSSAREEAAPAGSSPGSDTTRDADESSAMNADQERAWNSMDLPGMDPADGNE